MESTMNQNIMGVRFLPYYNVGVTDDGFNRFDHVG